MNALDEIQLKVTSLIKEKGELHSESERLSTLVDSLNGRVRNMTKQVKQEQMINDGFRDFQEKESTVFGQPASSKMLLSHLLIISLVGVTINGQVRRTFTCSRNPDAGATTSKAKAHTTNVGATTTKAWTTTTKAGTTTTKAGTTTTKDGATTTKAEAPTTTPGATTTKAGTPTNKAGATTTKAGATTTKAGATTTKAGATTTKAGAITTKAGATTTKAGTPTNKAGATTTKSGATTKAGATTTKAGATTNKAGMNKARACSSMSIVNGKLPNCTAIYIAGCKKSGIYNITPNGWTERPFEAYCDMENVTAPNWKWCRKHGWTVFQRRVNGSVDFNRNWTSYKEGFGQLNHEFWLGNEKLHFLTKEPGTYRLRIDLVSSSEISYHACYHKFHIKEEGGMYELYVSRFLGNNSLMDGLIDQNGKAFSTYDMDNTEITNKCANITQGGWWHKTCDGDYTNLNSVYGSNQDSTSIYWNGLPNGESIISSEMKIRHCKKCNEDD